jgi:hypothetical protein
MKLINFTSPRPQFSDDNGSPLALGRVSFYEAGTTTLKNIYTDADQTTQATNPHELDAGGFVREGGVWLDEGRYKVLIEKSDGAGSWVQEYVVDDVPGTSGAPGELTGAIIGTMAELRLLDPGAFGSVYITGYYEASDRGEDWFIWDENLSSADNGGTIISPNGAPAFGRWVRNVQQAEIIPQIFGGMTDTTFGVASNFQSMIDWCNEVGNEEYRKILINPGVYYIDGNVDFDNNIDLEIADRAFFASHPATSGTLSITCSNVNIVGANYNIVALDITLVFNPTDTTIRVNPQWFNGAPSFSALEQCATTSGTRDFQISSNLYIDPVETGSLSLPNLYFEKDAIFDNRSTSVSIYINSVNAGARSTPIFSNEFRNVRIDKGDMQAQWFNFSNDVKLEDMFFAVTDGNNIERELTWSEPTSVGGSNMTTLYRIDHHFKPGAVISCSVDVLFNSITSGKYRIFDENGAGNYLTHDSSLKPEWFGAVSNSISHEAQNVVSFNKMFTDYGQQFPITIDGGGLTYRFDSSITYSGAGILKISNMDFTNTVLASGVFFNMNGRCEFDNVSISCIAPTMLSNNASTDVDNTFKNCYFYSLDAVKKIISFFYDVNKLGTTTFESCRFDTILTRSYNSIYSDNFFISTTIEHTAATINEVTTFVFRDNSLKSLTGALSQIHLNGVAPNTDFEGIWIVGNTWVDRPQDMSGTYNGIYTTNASATGHTADVYNNTALSFLGVTIPTTRPKGLRALPVSTVSSSQTIVLDTHENFLPSYSAPITGFVCGAGRASTSSGAVGAVSVSYYSRNAIGVGTLPNITVDTVCASGGDTTLISYEFIISTNEVLKES